MTNETAAVELDDEFFQEIGKGIKIKNKEEKVKFLKRVILKNIEEPELRKPMLQLALLVGVSKKKISEEEYEKMREEAAEEIGKKFRKNPQV